MICILNCKKLVLVSAFLYVLRNCAKILQNAENIDVKLENVRELFKYVAFVHNMAQYSLLLYTTKISVMNTESSMYTILFKNLNFSLHAK